jgi:hypothetical protein
VVEGRVSRLNEADDNSLALGRVSGSFSFGCTGWGFYWGGYCSGQRLAHGDARRAEDARAHRRHASAKPKRRARVHVAQRSPLGKAQAGAGSMMNPREPLRS